MFIFITLLVGVGVVVLSQVVAKDKAGSVLPKEKVMDIVIKKAKEWNLDPALVKAMCKVESNFDPQAKNPADPSYGLMQITPMLAQDYGKVKDYRNPTNAEIGMLYEPSWNLDIGCAFLSRLMNLYEFDQAVQSYNLGERGYFLGYRNSNYLSKVRKYYGEYSI